MVRWIKYRGKILFSGDLKFNPKYPIETISLYENENSKKVYWVDGLNQPRVINIASETEWKDDSFNFVKEVISPDSVTIDTIDGGGQFSSGVIQYCITYVSAYLQESNIFIHLLCILLLLEVKEVLRKSYLTIPLG